MKLRKPWIGATAVIGAATFALAPAALAAPSTAAVGHGNAISARSIIPNSAIPVTGTLADGTALTGTLSNLSTRAVNGAIQLTGTLTSAALPGGSGNFVTTIPLDAIGASCPVLSLNLGPLDLDLLGLQVHLDPVVLDVTAVPGAGNLLGNLVCAVSHLLDNGGPLSGIANLLNNLLSRLG